MLCSSKHVSCLCRVGMSPKPYGGRSPWRSPGPIPVASAQRPPFKRPDAILCFPPPPSPADIRSPSFSFFRAVLNVFVVRAHGSLIHTLNCRRQPGSFARHFGVSTSRIYVARRTQTFLPQCTQSTTIVTCFHHSASSATPHPTRTRKSDFLS